MARWLGGCNEGEGALTNWVYSITGVSLRVRLRRLVGDALAVAALGAVLLLLWWFS